MRTRLVTPVLASALAADLNLPFHGDDSFIHSVAPLSDPQPNALMFTTRELAIELPETACLIAPEHRAGHPHIESHQPRLDFARALQALNRREAFQKAMLEPEIDPTAELGDFVSVGKNVTIGARTRIESFVRIADDVTIGADCWIKSGAVIGEAGFGLERDDDGTPVRLLHLGGVVIGDRVEVGSLTTVCQGTLGPTVIEDDAKVDDHVHVAHNCRIESKAFVIACAELSGGVVVGNAAWVGPNAAVIENVHIGQGALIGIGATVLRDVEPGATVVGNPARPLAR